MLLADEINRTPPRTQAALLEAMQEGHVTVDGQIHWLTPPFIVIATQNPFEHEGIFPLPESQLDRFFVKVVLEYGPEEDELKMLAIPHRGVSSDMLGDVRPLVAEGRFLVLQETVDETFVPDSVARFLINVVRKTRELPAFFSGEPALGDSPAHGREGEGAALRAGSRHRRRRRGDGAARPGASDHRGRGRSCGCGQAGRGGDASRRHARLTPRRCKGAAVRAADATQRALGLGGLPRRAVRVT